MASLLSLLNRLLPFATPGTPLIQDVIHLAAICTLLYFAPQIQEVLTQNKHGLDDTRNANRENDEDESRVEQDTGEADAPGAAPIDQDDEDLNAVDVPDDLEEDPIDQAPGLQPDGAPQVGPAGPAQMPEMPAQRNVGAKKAKSIARRDQRRAYNEFMRSQGDAQRAREAEGNVEREKTAALERQRRKAAEAALEAKKAKEREQKRAQERREREEEMRRRELVVGLVKQSLSQQKMCDLFRVARQIGDDVDEEWVEKILRASGLIGNRDGVTTMITGTGWAVRVSKEDMAAMYFKAAESDAGDEDGGISYEALGHELETVLRERAQAEA